MNRQHAKQILSTLLLCLFSSALLLSCDKSGNSPGGGDPVSNFKPSDFQVTITSTSTNLTSSPYTIYYEVKNLKNEGYTRNVENGYYSLRFKVATTDGTKYEDNLMINTTQAGGSHAYDLGIYYTAGKTIAPSTLTYEIYNDQ
ncbi:hypothetical protein [Taibaiella sp. KBW10]|uniref:hypothetical protein n=1 Tax=Taibaiella sp. KBW10 TaxID=2153357 RepID=UPI0011CE1CC9|nr:hypothetical protein [Taibaiella sp. KBW10]